MLLDYHDIFVLNVHVISLKIQSVILTMPLTPQVQNHLENSKYHLHQTQAQQVKQYLTLGTKLAGQAHPHQGQALGTMPVMRNGHITPVSDNSTPGSPVTLFTLANSHDTEVSNTPQAPLSHPLLINNIKQVALINTKVKGLTNLIRDISIMCTLLVWR